MNNKRSKEQIWFAASIFLVLRFTADATVPNCVERYHRCECYPPDMFDDPNNPRNDVEAGCLSQYPQKLDWESAEAVCKAEYRHLLNAFSHRVGDITKEQGIELMWLGIRRVFGFYVNLSVDPNFFKESKKEWGRQWDVDEPVHDCVALNVSSGRLVTRPCSTQLHFICQNEGLPSRPVPSLVCPDGRYFSYLSSIISQKCARKVANISYDFTATINISLTAEVLPHLLESFPSTDLSKNLLTCDLQTEGVSIQGARDQAFFQWYKNGIPISKHTYLFQVGFYSDPLKMNASLVSRQGFYQCGVILPGLSETVMSPELNYFYSDFSTHVLTLKGDRKEIRYQDFSQSGFRLFSSKLKKSMTLLIESLMESYPKHASDSSLSWDFQNVSVSGHLVAVTVLLYVKRNGPLFVALQNVSLVQSFWKSVEEKGGWSVSSLKIDSAGVCFEESVPSSETSCDGVLKWRETKQTRNAVSEPLCLKGWKLVTRECKPSLVDGARWGAFDYSLCSEYQPAVQDLEVLCPEGFKNFKPNLCYAIHHEGHTLDEAHELCHRSSSILMDSSMPDTKLFLELEPFAEYWISPKFSHFGFQWPGAEIVNEESLVLKDLSLLKEHSLGLRCVSVTFNTQFNFSPTDCKRKLPFVCIHQTYKPSTSIMFSRSWHKFPFQSSCFSTDSSKETWEEANSTCQMHSPNSSLLQSVQNKEEYPHIKFLLHTLEPFKTAGSWWMNLVQEAGSLKWLSSPEKPVTYVDWDVHTDFNLNAGLLSMNAEGGIHWTLRDPSSKERFICEMRNCRDTRPSLVYIEDKETSASNASDLHLFFHFHCVSSGWFVSDSISWYKDGLPLIANSALDAFILNVTVPVNVTNFGLFQGYYWCSMKQEKSLQERFSSKVLKRVPRLHTFVVNVESQPLQDASSDAPTFQCSNLLKKELYRAFKIFIEASSYKFYSDGVLHNVSCNSTYVQYYVHFYARDSYGDEKRLRNELEEILSAFQSKQDQLESVSHKLHVEITSLSVRSTIACIEEKINHNGQHITWPSVSIGETTMPEELYVAENGYAVERKCLGDFYVGAFWSPVPKSIGLRHGNEITASLHELSKTKINEENILNSSLNLEMLTTSPQNLEPVAVRFVAQILSNMAAVPDVEPDVLSSVINTVDNIIDAKRSMAHDREASSNVSSEISAAVESIVSNVHTAGQTVKAAGANIAVTLLPVNSYSSKIPKGGILENWNSNVTTLFDRDDFASFDTFEAGVIIPGNLITQMQQVKASDITIIVHKNYSYSEDFKIVSPMIEVNLRNFPMPDVPLYPRVEMEFEVSKISTSDVTLQCVFWDQMLNNRYGGWSYKGCNSLPLDSSHIRCECDHLTSFAVILDLKPGSQISVVHKRTLNVITYIGCSLSLIGLGFTILTFILFRKWRKEMKFKALFNLSLALSSFLLIFLFGIEKGNSEYRCMAVAILLHYLMLASFAWMLVEAFMQYLSLVKVIGTYIPRFIQKAMLFAWGLPLVVVVVVLAIDHKLYISKHEYCWLSDTVFYLAVAGPVLLMLTVNFGIFGLILYSNTCGRDKMHLRKNQNARQESLTRARAIFCVSLLLGLSWIFGFLAAIATEGLKILFQYLFAITTTSQGFFIFIFYVFRHKPTRSLWLSLITPSTTPEVSHISHNTGGTEVTKGHTSAGGPQTAYGRFSNVLFKAKPSYALFNT